MHMNKYLTSTLLAGLFLSTGILTPATAAQEQSLQPKGAWAITKVDRSAQGGNSYCTLSRKYEDGIVLSLGRNQTEEYSLAVDFQKDVFDKDKALKINLQPGPGQIRSYDMMPASQKAVVIRLGWDTGFFDALNQSQQMKIKVADQSYAFAMPEIAKGQDDLQECMKDLKIAAKGNAATAPTKDVLNAQIETSSGEFNAEKAGENIISASNLAAQKERLAMQEKAVLEGFANSIRAQEPSLNNDNAEARKNFATKGDEAKEPAAKKVQVAEAKKEEAAPPVAAAKTDKPVEKTAQEKPQQKDAAKPVEKAAAPAVQKSNAPVELVARPAPASDAEMKEMQKRLASLDSENNSLKQKAAGTAVEVQERIKGLEAEKKGLNEKLREAEQEIKRKAAVAAAANEAITDSVKAEVAALQKRLDDSAAENAAVTAKLAAAEKAAQEKAALATNTAAASEAVKAQIAALEKRIADEAAEKAVIAEKLKSAEKAASEKAAMASAASTSTNDVKNQVAALEKRLNDLNAQNIVLAQQASNINAQSQAKIEALTAEKKALEQKGAQVSPEMLAKVDALEAEKKGLTEKLALAQKEAGAKVAPAEKTAMETTIKKLEAENARLIAEASQAASAAKLAATNITPMPGDDATIKTLQKQLADMTAENAQLKQAPPVAAAAPEAVAKLESENKALSDKVALLEKTGGANAAKPEAMAAVEARAKELEIKNQQLEENLKNAQVRIAEAALNTESKSLKQIVDLEAKLDASKKDNMTLAKQLDDMKLQQEDKRMALVSGDPTLEGATKRYNEAEREIRRLGQQMEKQKETCSVEKAQIENMLFDPAVADQKQIDRLNQLEAEVTALRAGRGDSFTGASAGGDSALLAQLQSMQENLQGMKEANDEFNAQNEILRQEAERLRAQLADAQGNGSFRADRVASNTRRMEEMERELALKDKQNLTYHNQLAAIQKEKDRSAADDMNGITPAAGSVVTAAMAPAADKKAGSYGKGNLETMFKKAGLSVKGLSKTSAGIPGAENFGWSDNKVKGVASVKAMGNTGFTKMVDQYIADRKRACGGDFASMPSSAGATGRKTMALYEMACVGGKESVSSSMVFFEDQGRFVAIANEIDAADMDVAMDSRDKIAGAIGGM